METFKILSLSHGEDVDGIGSQAIIKRYFDLLNLPLPSNLISNADQTLKKTKIELVCATTDYIELIYYWAAIFAQNQDKIDLEKLNLNKDCDTDFVSLWKFFTRILLKGNDEPIHGNEFDEIGEKSKKIIIDLAKDLKHLNLIIVTDLGFNESLKTIFPILSSMKIDIAYFDHHEHETEVKNFFRENYKTYINDKEKCASQIVKDFFLPDDPVAKFIAELAVDTDYNIYKFPRSEGFMSYISRFIFNPQKIGLLRDLFANGEFSDEKITSIIDSIEKWEKKQEQNLINCLIIRDFLFSDKKSLLIMGISELKPGRAVRIIKKNFALIFKIKNLSEDINIPHIVLCLNKTNQKSNIRSNFYRIYEVAQHFGGGGHADRAGFVFPERFINGLENDVKTTEMIKVDEMINEIIPLLSIL
jgi:oligoribonuclease NrnB/cAMP/cGMP phosphodiesterase (DHH superfamily)